MAPYDVGAQIDGFEPDGGEKAAFAPRWQFALNPIRSEEINDARLTFPTPEQFADIHYFYAVKLHLQVIVPRIC